jgi:hypothetical protein
MTEEEARTKWPVRGRKNNHSKGYARLLSPNHPNADSGGYVYEHVYVASMVLERGLDSKRETVHHIYGNVKDNKKLLICTPAYHRQLHERLGKSPDWPQFLPRKSNRPKCRYCETQIAYKSSTGLCKKHYFDGIRSSGMVCWVSGCGAKAGLRSGLCLSHMIARTNKRRYFPTWDYAK